MNGKLIIEVGLRGKRRNEDLGEKEKSVKKGLDIIEKKEVNKK